MRITWQQTALHNKWASVRQRAFAWQQTALYYKITFVWQQTPLYIKYGL